MICGQSQEVPYRWSFSRITQARILERVLTCTSAESPAPAPSRDAAFLFSSCTQVKTGQNVRKTSHGWRRVEQQQRSYPLQQVSGLLCEVGRQTQLTLQDLVDGLFPVLAGKRRLQTKRRYETRVVQVSQDNTKNRSAQYPAVKSF